ncbi:helitron_like_N domain-containing protein [Trichonephila clavipes]|nr:helitron_like_N domain-containing protein [Trichonephila clavipes]
MRHSAYDALQYPPMFFRGEDAIKLIYLNVMKRLKSLRFLVDRFAKIETERLDWIRHNKKLRSEEYIHLKDTITATDGQLSELGKMVVLPSFADGSRYMHGRTQDAFVIPHGPILLWLKEIRPESIDKVICAELPDSKLDPALYEIIGSTMIHGPCEHINKSSPCMLNGNCTKNIQGASGRKLKQKMDIPNIVEATEDWNSNTNQR